MIIRNNTVSFNTHPGTNADPNGHVLLYGDSTGNRFENNEFISAVSDMFAVYSAGELARENHFDYNTWDVSSDRWAWDGVRRTDFKSSFRSVTGWEENGVIV
jgi:hypothetical protein